MIELIKRLDSPEAYTQSALCMRHLQLRSNRSSRDSGTSMSEFVSSGR